MSQGDVDRLYNTVPLKELDERALEADFALRLSSSVRHHNHELGSMNRIVESRTTSPRTKAERLQQIENRLNHMLALMKHSGGV
jgi:hypothetical protein